MERMKEGYYQIWNRVLAKLTDDEIPALVKTLNETGGLICLFCLYIENSLIFNRLKKGYRWIIMEQTEEFGGRNSLRNDVLDSRS